MRNAMTFLAVIAFAAMFVTGCAGPEQKLGRGISNTFEIVRMGDMRRSIEQNEIFDPYDGFATGVVSGFDKSITRTGVGIYEVVTAPIPPYHPVLTSYLTPGPVFPASYKPRRLSDPMFDTDTYTGFSGGDAFPYIPGSRFNVFD
jgi:putative exosortase-associated protein (TIGR04073 family)